jgi:hypothetical protein
MDTRAALQKAQHEILQNLVRRKQGIGVLYQQYATQFPDTSEFWTTLARGEAVHARVLEALTRVIDEGYMFWNIGQFRPEAIAKESAVVEQALNQAMTGNVTEKDAVFTAMQIETSPLESQFYSLLKCNAPDFDRIARKLTEASEQQLARIKAQLAESLRAENPSR